MDTIHEKPWDSEFLGPRKCETLEVHLALYIPSLLLTVGWLRTRGWTCDRGRIVMDSSTIFTTLGWEKVLPAMLLCFFPKVETAWNDPIPSNSPIGEVGRLWIEWLIDISWWVSKYSKMYFYRLVFRCRQVMVRWISEVVKQRLQQLIHVARLRKTDESKRKVTSL